MSAVTGTFRNGKIELHGPPPADWVDGTEVSVTLETPTGEDLEAGEDLHRILKAQKAENKAMWDAYCERIDRLSAKMG
jgi:hypothetical protein